MVGRNERGARVRLTALCLGGANTLDADRKAALALFTPDLIVACNHAGRDAAHVDHWVTMHPELFPRWIADRRAKGLPDAGRLWSVKHRPSPVECERLTSEGGSSGMFCIQVALHLGCTHIVLSGIPLDKHAEHYDYAGKWMDAPRYRANWTRYASVMAGRVRSVSGWTRDLLGAPDERWLGD